MRMDSSQGKYVTVVTEEILAVLHNMVLMVICTGHLVCRPYVKYKLSQTSMTHFLYAHINKLSYDLHAQPTQYLL